MSKTEPRTITIEQVDNGYRVILSDEVEPHELNYLVFQSKNELMMYVSNHFDFHNFDPICHDGNRVTKEETRDFFVRSKSGHEIENPPIG